MATITQNKRKVVVDGILSGHGWTNHVGEGVRLNYVVGSFMEPKRAKITLTRDEAKQVVEVLSKLLADTAALP